MNKEPFSELYDGIRRIVKEVIKRETSFFIAEITNPLPNLTVSFEGVDLDKDNLMISKSLLINNDASISCSTGSITHNLQDTLSTGDMVILYKKNDTTFVITDKVVNI